MQISIAVMVLDGKETMREGNKTNTCRDCGSSLWVLEVGHLVCSFFFLILKILFIFSQREMEGERERNISVWLLLTCPLLGTWPAALACALTGNQTHA